MSPRSTLSSSAPPSNCPFSSLQSHPFFYYFVKLKAVTSVACPSQGFLLNYSEEAVFCWQVLKPL